MSKILIDSYTTKFSIRNKKYFCMNFLHYFSSEEILINNQEIYLEIYAKQDVKISKEGSNVKAVATSFCNWWKF